jgi:DNA-binding NarL/FixJ family response regulator
MSTYQTSDNIFPSSDPQEGETSSSPNKWVFDPVIHLDVGEDSSENLLERKSLLLSTLDCIQDGVSILDTGLNVRYVNKSMKFWYSITENFIGLKCYTVYHNRSEPCENCPILTTIETKAPHIGIVKYTLAGTHKGWQQLFAIPIMDSDGELQGVLEYVRDVTYQFQLEQDLNRIMNQYQSLEKRSDAITQLLAQRKQEREQLEETISQNFEKFIIPSLNFLKTKSDAEEINLVETLIEEIVYPITKKRSSVLDRLTAREIQIATQIREGKTTSEIANDLVVSTKTIDFHRANIRKKLGLQAHDGNDRVNLATFLNSHL